MKEKTPEQVRHEKTVQEYKQAVVSTHNHIGLMGNQPSLRNIRRAFKSGDISEQDLDQVLNALANKLKGEPEPFKSKRDFLQKTFGGVKSTHIEEKPISEQVSAVSSILGDEAPKKKPSKPKAKPQPKIDTSLLPPELRSLING